MKSHLTHSEYLQLLGLSTLARRHDHAVSLLFEEALELTGADEDGYLAECILSEESVDATLGRMGVTFDGEEEPRLASDRR